MKKKYPFIFIFIFLQLAYFFLINDIFYNSPKNLNFSIYIKLLAIVLPKILKKLFSKKEIIPKYFISNIAIIFNNWCLKWDIFDEKYNRGILMYIFDFDSMEKIEKHYKDYLDSEIEKYVKKIYDLDSNKLINLGYEYGLDIDCDKNEIIKDLMNIKKIELLELLEKDIDGNIMIKNNEEEPKIQRILKSIQESIGNNGNKETKIEEFKNGNINKNKDIETNYDDIDGEPI